MSSFPGNKNLFVFAGLFTSTFFWSMKYLCNEILVPVFLRMNFLLQHTNRRLINLVQLFELISSLTKFSGLDKMTPKTKGQMICLIIPKQLF